MSEFEEPAVREALLNPRELAELEGFVDENTVSMFEVLGLRPGEERHGVQRAVVRESVGPGSHLLFDLRTKDNVGNVRFYPMPGEGDPGYSLTDEDKFVLFTHDIGVIEESRITVVNDNGGISYAKRHYVGPVLSSGRGTIGQGEFVAEVPAEEAILGLRFLLHGTSPVDLKNTQILAGGGSSLPVRYKYFAFAMLDHSPHQPVEVLRVSKYLIAIGSHSLRHFTNRGVEKLPDEP